jgi:hypothetical protein
MPFVGAHDDHLVFDALLVIADPCRVKPAGIYISSGVVGLRLPPILWSWRRAVTGIATCAGCHGLYARGALICCERLLD